MVVGFEDEFYFLFHLRREPLLFPANILLSWNSAILLTQSTVSDITLGRASFPRYVTILDLSGQRRSWPITGLSERYVSFYSSSALCLPTFLKNAQPGSAIKFNQYKREGCNELQNFYSSILVTQDINLTDTDFVALGFNNNAWNVVRSLIYY